MKECIDVDDVGNNRTPHLKVSIGASLAMSLAVALVSWGVTWGVYSQRIAATEALLTQSQGELAGQTTVNSNQEAKIAVLSAQYTEILRRLDSIDRKLER